MLASAMEKSLTIKWSTQAILKHAENFDWERNVQHVLDKMEGS